jgi:PAS domain S-box-containing protein
MSDVNIMIVEDKKIVAMDIENSLNALGYRVCASVTSGEEAVKKAEETHPDLILMDIMLSGEMDGIEAAGEIRSRMDVPVIYLTAYADDNTLRQATITEPYGYLIKPFEEKELGTSIKIALYKHNMEHKLREDEQWLTTTLNSIGDAVIATDEDGFIRLINPVAEVLTGWKENSGKGEALEAVVRIMDDQNGNSAANHLRRVLYDGDQIVLSPETVLISKDERRWPIEGNMAPIQGSGNRMMGAVLVFRDLTQKKRLEQEVLKSQKLDVVEALAENVAHGFNNYLTMIIGYIALAQIDAEQGEMVDEKLKKAKEACLLAKDLTRQLLWFSRGRTPRKETTFISKLARDCVNLTLKGSSLKCRFHIPHDLWPVEIDKGQIHQALSNVILNTLLAASEKESIELRIENTTAPSHDGSALKTGKYVKLSICGQIEPSSQEDLAHMFDPTFVINQGEKGLGLATVYSIVHGHGGCVNAEPLNDSRTAIHIYLPASDKEVVETKYMEGEFPLGKGKVLLMDDEEMIRDAVGRVLRYFGYEVILAKNTGEALELHEKCLNDREPFDVIIMDLATTEDVELKETVEKLHEIQPNAKAILSCRYTENPIMLNYKEYGFVDVIAKPYQVEELNKTLHRAIVNP